MSTLSLTLDVALATVSSASGGPDEPFPGRIGEYCEVEVPDTLDLAEHACYSRNHFISIIDEGNDYHMCSIGDAANMSRSPLVACQPKCWER